MAPNPPSGSSNNNNNNEGRSSYYGGNGKTTAASASASAAVVATKMPGTPRREATGSGGGGHGREKAVQDPGLKDYRLGDCIGKGAFGSVYKAFNWGTGEAVAVKQIKLVDVPKSELRMIEAEIDLLKNLHHDNIVKYIGFVKTADCLNIILEYCENGSLHSICKAYGKFPENLVGVYMTQVLQGLQYLHDQGVIHRDIKGANILTTKDGTVKLADFGVSTSTLAGPDKEAQVVGTPYWMAPEIIQLSGATSASDIWSVGCTVIELLQGKPPYHHLAAMPALFAIVNDDHPPLPEGVSPAARDFLMQCFQKDPNLRVSAKKLLRHSWIQGCRRSDAPISKAPSNFSQAVEEVKQWNKALKSSEANPRTSIGSDHGLPSTQNRNASGQHRPNLSISTKVPPPQQQAKPKPSAEAFRSPGEEADDDNWDNDFATAISPSALHLPHIKGQDNFGGLLSSDRLKAFASIDSSREDTENWDEDFGGDFEQTIRPLPKRADRAFDSKSSQQGHRRQRSSKTTAPSTSQTKSPVRTQFGNKFELPPRPESIYREQSTEDYSDLFGDTDSVFNSRLNVAVKDAPQLFHPSDLTSLPRSTASPVNGSSMRRQSASARPPSSAPEQQPAAVRRTRTTVEITKFAEDEGDEDFSDIFGAEPESLTNKPPKSDEGSEDGQHQLMLLSKLSNNSWLGDDEDEDDPFAMMDPGWDEMDLEANIARDRHARLAEKVEERVRSLKPTESEDILADLAEDLLALLWENTEVKDLIISAHGLLPILEILEPCTVKSRQHMILQLLKIVNAIILDDVELQENLCFVGGIPIITKFAARQYSNEIRLEAAAFVRQMYQTSTLTLQMFVSAGGLNVLVEFLDEDYDMSPDLVLIGVNGIWNVFELQGPTPKNDFCRIFSRSKILDPLAAVLHKVLDEDDRDELSELIEARIVNIFYLFSQAENYVKEVVAERFVLKTVLKDLRRMTPAHQITMLKFIKNLSMLSTTLESLHSADAIDYLIDVLSNSMKRGQQHFREISNQVLNTMFNLCRLSKERQEYAASNGIIPLLLKIMKTDRPPKEFVLPILCDMAHSGSKGRRYLWQNNGLEFYVSLLADQYWQVTALDAIFVWLEKETAKVEHHLLEGNFTAAITSCFNTNKANAFDANLLEPLLKLVRLSPSVAASLAKAEMYAGIAQKLSHKKAVVRLNLLRLVRSIMDGCEANNTPMATMATSTAGRALRVLFDDIQILADKDPAVLVRNLASEIVRSRIDIDLQHDAAALSGLNLGPGPSAIANPLNNLNSGPRSRSGPRRNTSYTPPGLHNSMSMPPTPTHGHRASHSSSAAYIEVASTPKRSGISLAQEREGMFRPHSRDGGNVPLINIPRRVSQDTSAGTTSSGSSLGSAAGGIGTPSRMRLPRMSMTQYSSPRPSLSSAATAPGAVSATGMGISGIASSRAEMRERERSDSAMSNYHKENYGGRIRSGSSVAGPEARIAGNGLYSVSPTGSAVSLSSSFQGSGSIPEGGNGMFSRSYGARESSFSATGGGSAAGNAKRRSRAPSSDMRWS
ncbi:hypothetical protein B0T20DRAFT_17874 [Sordaria brevicollis]|uniref:non-specific serine/threonine protein kinase n=1 Tax=Sordaria brevicollis TaxID=83679 RepID=A0AAE0PNI5_SORBR|nr:hypothetical protein B0T20DRAFT_17874 [Sordaria brevicollis]